MGQVHHGSATTTGWSGVDVTSFKRRSMTR